MLKRHSIVIIPESIKEFFQLDVYPVIFMDNEAYLNNQKACYDNYREGFIAITDLYSSEYACQYNQNCTGNQAEIISFKDHAF